MKKVLFIISFLLLGLTGWAQSLPESNVTREHRLTQAQDKKSKRGKKKLSMEKKVKIARQQDRKAERKKAPKSKARKPKPKM
jgi:hypothetical protein